MNRVVTENASKRVVSRLQQSVAARAFFLVAVAFVLFALCVAASIGFGIQGGVQAAGLAMVACLAAGLLSTFVGEFFRGDKKALFQLGFGMAIRMFGLLGLTLFVHFRAPHFVDSGFIFFLLVFYGADLLIETAMLLGGISDVKPALSRSSSEVAG